jgi:molecular chaperone GrpE
MSSFFGAEKVRLTLVENDEGGNILAEQQEGKPKKEEGGEVEVLRAELESIKSELRRAKESSESSLNKLRYLMADFDNYRKQMEKQLASKAESIKAELLLKFLNIRDDYIRALSMAKQSKSDKEVVIEGLEGILKNIDSLLTSEGAREIEAIGTPFDPNVHDAIAYSERNDLAENTVTAEIRKSYMLNGRVLRPSLVEISKIVKNSVNDTKEMDIQGGG